MRKLLLSFVLLSLVTTGGCGGKKSGGFSRKGNAETEVSKVSFVRRPVNEAPPKVRDKVNEDRVKENAELVTDNGQFWIILTRGEMRTGGYDVKVTGVSWDSAVNAETRLVISYKYTDPAPGTMVTQSLTYPMDLVMIKGLKKMPDQVTFIRSNS